MVEDLCAGIAHDEVDGGSGAGEALEEAPSVEDPGPSGDGEDESAFGHRTLLITTQIDGLQKFQGLTPPAVSSGGTG
jgi:hypothetical protein